MRIKDWIGTVWRRITAPWRGTAREELSLSDGSFAQWLRDNSNRRGTLSEITYFTCLKVLAETMGKLPWKVYRREKEGVRESGLEDVKQVLQWRPNPYTAPAIFWNAVEMNRVHYGNAYVYIQRNTRRKRYGGENRVNNLWLMPSNCVKVLVDDGGVFGNRGKIWYRYQDPYSGKSYLFKNTEVCHYKASHTFNGLVGMPVQQILAETFGGAKEAQRYMNKLHQQGLTAKAVLEYTGSMSQEAQDALRSEIEYFSNGADNTGRILPIPLGMKLTPLNIKLTDAQFFELRKYTALQIAGAMGVKPNQINDYEKSSYANSEMQQLSFLTETMLFTMKQYEEETGYKVIGSDAWEFGEYVKLNEKAILRTDSKTQMEIMKGYTDSGIYRINESREHLDMERVEGGDTPIVNSTMRPLTEIRQAE